MKASTVLLKLLSLLMTAYLTIVTRSYSNGWSKLDSMQEHSSASKADKFFYVSYT